MHAGLAGRPRRITPPAPAPLPLPPPCKPAPIYPVGPMHPSPAAAAAPRRNPAPHWRTHLRLPARRWPIRRDSGRRGEEGRTARSTTHSTICSCLRRLRDPMQRRLRRKRRGVNRQGAAAADAHCKTGQCQRRKGRPLPADGGGWQGGPLTTCCCCCCCSRLGESAQRATPTINAPKTPRWRKRSGPAPRCVRPLLLSRCVQRGGSGWRAQGARRGFEAALLPTP